MTQDLSQISQWHFDLYLMLIMVGVFIAGCSRDISVLALYGFLIILITIF
jgi:hypothetical protein